MFARDSEVRKILRVAGRGFYLGWAQGFQRKNSCVHYFRIICLLLSQDQSVRSTNLTVRENLALTQFTSPFVSCTLKSTYFLQVSPTLTS